MLPILPTVSSLTLDYFFLKTRFFRWAVTLMIPIHSWTFMYQTLTRKRCSFKLNACSIDVFLLIRCGDLYMLAYGFRVLQMRSCAYYPKYGFGAFGIFPLLRQQRFATLEHLLTHAHINIVQTFVDKEMCPRIIWWTSSRHMLTWFTICRLCSEDYGLMGLRYGSRNLSLGVTLMPFSCN